MEAAIWGLVGTVVGALASIGTTWLSSRSAHLLQSDRERLQRLERENEFQRTTLIDLQEALHHALRLIHKAYMHDVKAHRAAGSWAENSLPDEVDESARLAMRRVAILVERIESDTARQRVKSLMHIATAAMLANSPGEAEAKLNEAASSATDVLEQIGSALRARF